MESKRNNSRKRQALLHALLATKEHPSAETLYMQLKTEYPEISLGTVYRNLAILVDEGRIISVGKVNGQERYDATTDAHAHFICRSCDRVIDLDLPDMTSSMFSEIEQNHGCHADSFTLSINGLCKNCREL